MNNNTDERLDVALRRADPARSWSLETDAVDAVLKELGSASKTHAARARAKTRKGWIALVVAGAVGLAGLGAAAPAAAGFLDFLARTGEMPPTQPSASGKPSAASEFIPGSELIKPLAPDYAAFAKTKYGHLPLPAGYDEDRVKTQAAALEAETYRLYSGGKDIITQDVAPKARYESVVRCLWMNQWLDSYSAGDAAGRAAAVTVLRESLAWPATVATDGGGVIDHMSSIVRAATDGDLPSVNTGVDSMQCAALTKGITR